MIHSRDGAMAGMIAIWHGTAKDRKAIIKSFKTHVTKIAMEEYGHAVLLAIFDSVDDTKLVGKAIVGEIAENIDQIAANKYGIRVVKYLIAGRATAYIAPHVLKLLEQGDGNEHSKKDLSLRHSELATVAAAPILSWVTANLGKGLYDPPTTITFTAIINHSPVCQQLTDLLSELAEEAVKPFIPGDAEQPNIVESGASHMLLKKIIIKDKERSAIGQDTFSNLLLKNIDSEGLDAWATCNRGAMLLVYMYETAIKEVESLVQEKVESVKRTLQRQKTKGAEILLKKLNL
jgi:pumilio family protein 6